MTVVSWVYNIALHNVKVKDKHKASSLLHNVATWTSIRVFAFYLKVFKCWSSACMCFINVSLINRWLILLYPSYVAIAYLANVVKIGFAIFIWKASVLYTKSVLSSDPATVILPRREHESSSSRVIPWRCAGNGKSVRFTIKIIKTP